MELIWNELPAEQIIYSGVSQALVEGTIPLPEGRSAAEVLSYTGEVTVNEASSTDGAVLLEGFVSIDLICLDGSVFAFSSRAAFRHSIPAAAVKQGMAAQVQPALQSLDIASDGGRITLNAVADLACRVTLEGGCKTLSSISGAPDAESETLELSFYRRTKEACGTLRLREEIDAPLAAAVLYSEVRACAREANATKDGILIEGTLYISALVESKTGALNQLTQAIPFSETVEGSGAGALCAEVSVADFELHSAEDFGVVVADIQLAYSVYGRLGDKANITLDTFSPTAPFSCTHGRLRLSSYAGCAAHRHSLAETLMLPEGLPEVQRVIYATARPAVTSYGFENGVLSLEGLLFTRVLYAAESGSIFAFSEDVPFALDMEAPDANEALISAFATASASGSGRSIELNCTVCVSAALYSLTAVSAVNGIEECPAHKAAGGLAVYFASQGDTLYSVAKLYNVHRADILCMNPTAPERFAGGEKLMFMRA